MKHKKLLFLLIAMAVFFSGYIVKAETVDVAKQSQNFMDIGAEEAGLKEKGTTKSLGIFMAEIIKDFMGAFGIILVLMIFIAGFMLITAQGEDEKVKLAYKIIEGAIIGLLLVLSAFAIASFITKKAVEVTNYGVTYLDTNNQV